MITRVLIRNSVAIVFLLIFPAFSGAEPPELIRVQGATAQLGGTVVTDGNYEFLVQVFDVAIGGQALFSTTVISAIAAGAYSLPVIPVSPGDLRDALSGDGARFVQITVIRRVGGSTFNEILLPRQQLASVPYALDAPAPAGFGTGDVKLTFKAVADPGWLLFNDGAIGNASSNANSDSSVFASDEAHDLFLLLWTNISDLPVQNSAGTEVDRGANADSDWNANRRLVLPKALGRTLAAAGAGVNLTSRELGETVGEESHVLTEAEMPSHLHAIPGTTGSAPGSFNNHTGTVNDGTNGQTLPTGGGAAHNNMQPTLFLNVMIKL